MICFETPADWSVWRNWKGEREGNCKTLLKFMENINGDDRRLSPSTSSEDLQNTNTNLQNNGNLSTNTDTYNICKYKYKYNFIALHLWNQKMQLQFYTALKCRCVRGDLRYQHSCIHTCVLFLPNTRTNISKYKNR